VNRPIDDWPSVDATGLRPLDVPSAPPPSAAGTIAELKKGASGSDPDAFERAVCATFELFGFAATHVGGNDAPDGYADALLGELGYRIMLECKLARPHSISGSDAAAEASQFRGAYHADYSALVAPAYDAELRFISELRTHEVNAWTVDDLLRAVTLQLDCLQMRALFVPGFAADQLDDLAWVRVHGPAKRLRVVATLLLEIGLEQQRIAHTLGSSASAPRLSPDVAISLIDDRLAAFGSTQGVTREEIDASFTWLTSPYVGRAVWTGDDRTAIVIKPVLPFDSAQGDTGKN
jgi:hypothetical protein